jgi:hypothetical protein
VSTAKVSVAIGQAELAWARERAKEQGKSLSAVLTESLAEQKRLAALQDVLDWMGEGKAPLSDEELANASKELGLFAPRVSKRRVRKASVARRR